MTIQKQNSTTLTEASASGYGYVGRPGTNSRTFVGGTGASINAMLGPKVCDPFEKNIKTVSRKDDVNTLEVPSCSCSSSLLNVQVMNLRYNNDSLDLKNDVNVNVCIANDRSELKKKKKKKKKKKTDSSILRSTQTHLISPKVIFQETKNLPVILLNMKTLMTTPVLSLWKIKRAYLCSILMQTVYGKNRWTENENKIKVLWCPCY